MTLDRRQPTLNEHSRAEHPAQSGSTTVGNRRVRALFSFGRAAGRAVTFERLVSVALILAALYTFAYAAAVLGARCWYESHLPYNVDVPLYWTVGRGILEGHVPYRDLFETKPPGIFLLSAFSFWLTGKYWLTNFGQIASLAIVAFSPFVFLFQVIRAPGRVLPRLGIWIALASLVLVLAAFAGQYSDEVQVETFGLAGTVIYMLLVDRRGKLAFIGRACGIALAIGMKEPFLLVVPAIYLVLRKTPRRDLADLWGPLATAGLAGTLFLALAGWLVPFFKIYLRTMVTGHVKLSGSPIDRALAFELTWGSLKNYAPFLPYVLLYVFFVYVTSGTRAGEGAGPSSTVQRIQATFVGLLLSWLAVGMGGTYYAHHYVLAVPLYLAVIFSLLGDLPKMGEQRWFASGIVGLVYLLPVWRPLAEYETRATAISIEDSRARSSAAVIDEVLDRLQVDRYLWLGPGGYVPLPYTRHVPLGPMFFQQVAFFEGKYSKHLVAEFRKSLAEARVVVLWHHLTGPLEAEVREVLNRDYERLPQGLQPRTFPYEILVRKGVLDSRPKALDPHPKD